MCKDTRYFDFIIRKRDNEPHRGTPKVMVRVEAKRSANGSYTEVRRASAVCHEKDQPSKKMFKTIAGGRLDTLKQSHSDMSNSTLDCKKRNKASHRYNSLKDNTATFTVCTRLKMPKIPSILHLKAPLLEHEGPAIGGTEELLHIYLAYLCRDWHA